MTIARDRHKKLPPLAQAMNSDEGFRRLQWRVVWVSVVASLAPCLVLGGCALVFLDELKEAYFEGAELWGWRVVAIGEEARGWISIGDKAVGVVAIGQRAVGVLAIGGIAIGLVAIGLMGMGVVAIGLLAVGLGSVGTFSLGWFSIGSVAMGRLAWGAVCVGWYAWGAVAVGAYAWGAMTCWGFFRAESRDFMPRRPPERERLLFPHWRPKPPG